MQIYLPIAELSLNVFLLLGIGGAIGFLSGMFGVGGGFLLTPLLILVGLLAAIMGTGGAFIMVPAMIYLLGMPTAVVVGTSLFQIIFVAANVTFLQSLQNQTVDVVLALMLTVGGVIGAQFGGRVGARLPAEHLRVLLALLVLAVGARPGSPASGSTVRA